MRAWEFGNAESLADFEQSVTRPSPGSDTRASPAEIVVGVTHGRRPMTYGAITAADAADVEVRYLANPWDQAANRPIPGQEMFTVVRERWALGDLRP
jgi:hypothetical protein